MNKCYLNSKIVFFIVCQCGGTCENRICFQTVEERDVIVKSLKGLTKQTTYHCPEDCESIDISCLSEKMSKKFNNIKKLKRVMEQTNCKCTKDCELTGFAFPSTEMAQGFVKWWYLIDPRWTKHIDLFYLFAAGLKLYPL